VAVALDGSVRNGLRIVPARANGVLFSPSYCDAALVGVIWIVVGTVLGGLLLMSWLLDRRANRRKARLVGSRDIWREVREGRRDARVIDSVIPGKGNNDWTSWSRRGRGGR